MINFDQTKAIAKQYNEWEVFIDQGRWWFRVGNDVRGGWDSRESAQTAAHSQHNIEVGQ